MFYLPFSLVLFTCKKVINSTKFLCGCGVLATTRELNSRQVLTNTVKVLRRTNTQLR